MMRIFNYGFVFLRAGKISGGRLRCCLVHGSAEVIAAPVLGACIRHCALSERLLLRLKN